VFQLYEGGRSAGQLPQATIIPTELMIPPLIHQETVPERPATTGIVMEMKYFQILTRRPMTMNPVPAYQEPAISVHRVAPWRSTFQTGNLSAGQLM
jgi:hypothetical protein